jgi:uncharacterized repeat protein (TIGR02543 family)
MMKLLSIALIIAFCVTTISPPAFADSSGVQTQSAGVQTSAASAAPEGDFAYSVSDDGAIVSIAKYEGDEGVVYIPSTSDGASVYTTDDDGQTIAPIEFTTKPAVTTESAATESDEFDVLDASAVSTQGVVDSGSFGASGNNLMWSLDDSGVLTISGTGAMDLYSYSAPWSEYDSLIRSVIISYGVTNIRGWAFDDCSSLTSISIPDSVISIGNCAFSGCRNLPTISIPDSVTSIGDSIFFDCRSLTEINVASGNTNYTSDGEVLLDIRTKTLIVCSKGKAGSYAIPNGVTSIEGSAFMDCRSLNSINIPDSVTSIGSNAFGNCPSLTSISIPDSVTFIGVSPFLGSANLIEINVALGNTKYVSDDGVLFDKDKKTLIACSRGKAGLYAIPNGVTSIGIGAFWFCRSLSSISIPDSVTSIESNAFTGCRSLTSISVPKDVTSIMGAVFGGCSSLTEIKVASDNASYVGDGGVLFDKDKKTLKAYPGGKAGSYVIPDSVTSIEPSAFYDCSSLTEINVASGNANYVGYDGALFDKEKNTLIACPGGKAGPYVIPDGVTSIDSGAFNYCSSLTSISIPDSVTSSIRDFSFMGCSSLTEIKVASGNVNYASDGGVLFDKDKKTLIACPNGKADPYVIPDGVTSIGYYAFTNCSNLTNISIPNSVISIGLDTFTGSPVKLRVYAGSYAHSYAIRNNIPYSLIGESPEQFTVIFDANGGSMSFGGKAIMVIIDKGNPIGYLPEATRSGYTFLGWFTASTGGAQISASTLVTENITYYAQWASSGGDSGSGGSGGGSGGGGSGGGSGGWVGGDGGGAGVAPGVAPAKKAAKSTAKPAAPKKLSAPKATAGKKQIKITWKKSATKGISGYEVQYRIVGKEWATKKVSANATSLTIKKLKPGKSYEVRVRAVKKSGGKTAYGSWSKAVKSGKVKR